MFNFNSHNHRDRKSVNSYCRPLSRSDAKIAMAATDYTRSLSLGHYHESPMGIRENRSKSDGDSSTMLPRTQLLSTLPPVTN